MKRIRDLQDTFALETMLAQRLMRTFDAAGQEAMLAVAVAIKRKYGREIVGAVLLEAIRQKKIEHAWIFADDGEAQP